MTGITEILALLSALTQLLTFIAANPGIPAEARANALELAEQSIVLTRNAITQHRLALPPVAPPRFQILPQPTHDLRALERTIHNLINQERERLLLAPLALDPIISAVSRNHSEDQAHANRLTTPMQKPCAYPTIRHEGITPAGVSLTERLDAQLVPFRRAGENIVLLSAAKEFVYRAPSAIVCPSVPVLEIPRNATLAEAQRIVSENIAAAEAVLARIPEVAWVRKSWHDLETIAQRAVTGWIESPGHYANIANEHFTLTGIGAAEVNRYIIVTQVFVGRQ